VGMEGPPLHQPVRLVCGSRQIRGRVIRRMRKKVYVDALTDADALDTPRPGSAMELRWVDDGHLWTQPAVICEVLDPLPLLTVEAVGPPTILEQRSVPRIKATVPLEYGMLRQGAHLHMTTTLDLSVNGLRFPAEEQLWPGLTLRLRLYLAREPLALLGSVRRVGTQPTVVRGRHQWETGVEFYQMSAAARAQVEAFVRHLQSRELEPARSGRSPA
jgi:hypothetical protein